MKTVVPFVDLKAQYGQLKAEVMAAVERVFDSCAFVMGPDVREFEQEFASAVGARFGVAVNTGTSALHLALQALGIGPGDEVLVPAMTFVATAAAVRYTGARCVFVDVDPDNYTLAPEHLERHLTERTRAIMPVHLYGQSADMDPILAFAKAHNLKVVEDACQAHLGEYKGRKLGTLGDAAGFSFYPGKNLGAYGEGGLITTNDPALAQTMGMLRDWGAREKYHHVLAGYNYRLDTVQAAILRIKLRHLEQWTAARRRHAAYYDKHLAGLNLKLPRAMEYARHVYHLYTVQVCDRAAVMAALAERGVHTGIHYPIPVHLQEAYNDNNYKSGDFPVAERVGAETMSLPMFAELSEAQLEHVVGALKDVVGTAH